MEEGNERKKGRDGRSADFFFVRPLASCVILTRSALIWFDRGRWRHLACCDISTARLRSRNYPDRGPKRKILLSPAVRAGPSPCALTPTPAPPHPPRTQMAKSKPTSPYQPKKGGFRVGPKLPKGVYAGHSSSLLRSFPLLSHPITPRTHAHSEEDQGHADPQGDGQEAVLQGPRGGGVRRWGWRDDWRGDGVEWREAWEAGEGGGGGGGR